MTQRIAQYGLTIAVLFAWVPSGAWAENPRETPEVRAVNRVVAAVVNLNSEKTTYSGDAAFGSGSGRGRKVNGMGTGILIDERGYIVTNHHVVDGVDTLTATLEDKSTYNAEVVAFDKQQDLAVIKIRASRPLPVMPLGTSSDIMLGETVLAIGNAFGYHMTVTKGIVSALGRDVEVNEKQGYRNLVQTDASINPGNSGGPLINLDGEVVGINVAIRAGAQRIGFAIPIDDARKIIAKMISVEHIDQNWHGITVHDVKSGKKRELLVDGAAPESPAAAAGLQPKDVIVRAGNVDVVDGADLERALLGRAPGDKVEVTVRRENKLEKLTIALASRRGAVTADASRQDVSIRAQSGDDDVSQKMWKSLGVKLAPVGSNERLFAGSKYRGGMRVTDVRRDGPAAAQGIQPGDILVGLHVWETINVDNVTYVIDHPQLGTFSPLKFYILRGRETLFGHFQLASSTK